MLEADIEVKQLTMQRLQQISNTAVKVHGDTHKSREQGMIPRMYMQVRQLLDEVEENSIYYNPVLSIDGLANKNSEREAFILCNWLDIRYRIHALNLLKKLMQKQELADSMKFDKGPDIPLKKKENLPTALRRLPSTFLNTARSQNEPFYYDEVSLSIFTEQFLDYFIEESFKKVMRKRENSTTKIKILRDVIQLVETDRVVFKFHNQIVQRFLNTK